jgi:hypothetical protein
MMQRQLASALFDWAEAVQSQKQWHIKLGRCERFVQVMQRRALFQAYARWIEMTSEVQGMRVKVRRCLHRMMQRQLASALFDWADKIQSKKEWEQKLVLTEHEQKEQTLLKAQEWDAKVVRSERFVAAMQRRTAHAAFSRWAEMWQEVRTMRAMAIKVGFMIHI